MTNAWWEKIPEHLLVPQQSSVFPINWEQEYPEYDQFQVEIGFGNGEFLVHSAKQNNQALFVGYELSLESCEKLIKKAIQENVSNVKLIRGDAGVLLRELFAENSVHHVYMNFPDPWPKKRHEEKRLIKKEFVKTLANVLTMGGMYELTTDQQFYAETAKELFEQSPWFEIDLYETNPVRPVQTKYERKWLVMGRDIYQLRVKKTKSTAIERIFEGDPMPHVKIKEPIKPENSLKEIVGKEFKTGKSFFKILDYYKKDEQMYLLRTVSNDDGFVQNYFIKIVHRTDEWLIKLDEITQPFRTPAVKFSVFEIGRKLSRGKSNES